MYKVGAKLVKSTFCGKSAAVRFLHFKNVISDGVNVFDGYGVVCGNISNEK